MNAGDPVNQGGDEGQRIRRMPPPLRGVMWFRFGLGSVACLGMVAVFIPPGGELALMMLKIGLSLILAIVGLPSMAVAYGLWKRRRWAPGLTLGHDLSVVVLLTMPYLVGPLREFIMFGGYLIPTIAQTSAAAAIALMFGAEACHVAKKVWGWRLAWHVYALVAVGLVLATTLAPVMASKRLRRHVTPLLAHIDANWFAIPQNARVSVESWPNGSDGHRDRIHVEMQHLDWFVIAHHAADGGWRFPAGGGEEGDTFHGRQHDRQLAVRSIEDAQKVLADSGMTDPDLGPGRLVEGEYGAVSFEFWSPKAKGFVRVGTSGDIWFYLKDPLEVP